MLSLMNISSGRLGSMAQGLAAVSLAFILVLSEVPVATGQEPAAVDSSASGDPAPPPSSSADETAPAPPTPAPASMRSAGEDSAGMRVYVLPDTVDVAGQRRDETPSAPTSTEIRVDRTEIDAFLPATVADALISVPGVDVVKTGAW